MGTLYKLPFQQERHILLHLEVYLATAMVFHVESDPSKVQNLVASGGKRENWSVLSACKWQKGDNWHAQWKGVDLHKAPEVDKIEVIDVGEAMKQIELQSGFYLVWHQCEDVTRRHN